MKKVNGNPNVLSEEQENQRIQIIDLELKARYWEAQWKIRFYTLESEKLQPEYDEFLNVQKAKQEEAIKRFQEQIDKMNQEAAAKQSEGVVEANKEFLDKIPSDPNLRLV